MTAREFVKILLAKEGMTLTELIRLANENNKNFTIYGISHKMSKGTLRFEEFEYFCKLLNYEIDIKKVESIWGMFYECESIESLPNIAKWKTNSLINMKELFSGCSSLK